MLFRRLEALLRAHIEAWCREKGLEPGPLSLLPAPAHVPADASTGWPLQAAKRLKLPPPRLAQELAASLAPELGGLASAGFAAPGFLNLVASPSALAAELSALLDAPAAYGRLPERPRERVLVEFVSANPTGPLHMASGRAATLGDSLVRILRKLGYDAKAEYYVNDAGRQTMLLGESLQARYQDREPSEGGYMGDYITATARGAPPDAARWTPQQFADFGIDHFVGQHKNDMDAFRVRFDRWFRESELHEAGELEEALKALRGKGKVVEKEGATWFASAEDEDDKDRVLVRSDGRPTYFLADIAYHFDKLKRADRLVDVWGADHHGYVPRMKAAVEALGGAGAFHPVVHQLVHLYRGSEKVKMSKRAGEFITLRELVEEVGVDACRFFFAMRGPHTHLNFDLELAKKKSQENPVYYVQYVHARIRSIAAEAAKRGIPEGRPPAAALEGLKAPEERALLVKLGWFPAALELCAREDSPHHLATYLTELAGLFHPFYERCRVADPAEPERSQARLALCEGVRLVIREGLDLLGIEAPERM